MKVNPQTDQFAAIPQHDGAQAKKADAGGQQFAQILGGAVQVAGQLAGTVAGAQGFGLGGLAGNLLGGGGAGGLGGGDPSTADLLQMQNQIQRESLVFNAQTNISKTDHDTRMAAVRNIRAG
ncbi:MAG: hypothetical protein ACAI43_25405 [Phycisphaerae bacterium]|nr:hypothetical protein [Tepidisphaeraceae bacterium]